MEERFARSDLGPAFFDAVPWAAELHAGQVRRGGSVPYLSHLLAVAALVLEDRGDETAAVAAILHDAVEDQGGWPVLVEIRARFGDPVADIVEVCSDSDGSAHLPWAERKAAHLARWQRGPVPIRALTVAAADKLNNVRSLVAALHLEGIAAWNRYDAGPADVIGYYAAMADILEERLPGSRNVFALRVAVTELETIALGTPGTPTAV